MNKLRLILSAFCCVLCHWSIAQDNMDRLFAQANSAFRSNDFTESIRLYDEIIEAGYYSADLYSNMASSYLQIGNVGRTILNLEKALLIDPYHSTARSNMVIAKERIKDPLTFIPDFILASGWRNFIKSLGVQTWTILHIAMLSIAIALLFVKWTNFSGLFWIVVREWRFTGMAILLVTLLSFFFMFVSFQRANQLNKGEYGIVMMEELLLYEGPDERSPNLSEVTEGSKVKILDSLNQWYKVELEDKDEGWLRMQSVALIKIVPIHNKSRG